MIYVNIYLVIIMSNRKIALIISIFAAVLLVGCLLLGIGGHIPFLSKGITLIIALMIMIFVLVFFILIMKVKSKK